MTDINKKDAIVEIQKDIPKVSIDDNTLTISISLFDLVRVIEYRTDENYRVVKPDKLLYAFKAELDNYAKSNASELGLTELQYLFDRIVDEIAVNYDIIEFEK